MAGMTMAVLRFVCNSVYVMNLGKIAQDKIKVQSSNT